MSEDVRQTISPGGSFHGLLVTLYRNGGEVHLLYDENGITRANGKIRSMDADQLFLEMEDGTRIMIASIVAVNGLFASDYSEC